MVSGKKVVIAISVMGMAIAFSLGLLTRPAVLGADSEKFSAVRVSRDIEVISREPHSLENPEARSRVRAYLASRLSEIGFDVEIKQYDSVKMRSGSYTSIFNIQASAARHRNFGIHSQMERMQIQSVGLHYSLDTLPEW